MSSLLSGGWFRRKPTPTQASQFATCEDITSQKLAVNYGGYVFTRSGFRWGLIDPDRASTVFPQQQGMVNRMDSGTMLAKSNGCRYDQSSGY